MDTSPYEPGNPVHTLRLSPDGSLFLGSALDRVEGGVGDSLHAGPRIMTDAPDVMSHILL